MFFAISLTGAALVGSRAMLVGCKGLMLGSAGLPIDSPALPLVVVVAIIALVEGFETTVYVVSGCKGLTSNNVLTMLRSLQLDVHFDFKWLQFVSFAGLPIGKFAGSSFFSFFVEIFYETNKIYLVYLYSVLSGLEDFVIHLPFFRGLYRGSTTLVPGLSSSRNYPYYNTQLAYLLLP